MGENVLVKACVPLMSMCDLRGRTCVSSCKCCMGVVLVQPVAMRNAVFCVICNLSRCVLAMSGCQAVWAYVRIGRMYCLYVVVMSSLECPYVVCVRALMTFRRVLAFVLIVSVWCLNVMPLSSVTPNMVGVFVTGMGVLFRVTCGCTVYSLL